LQSIAAANSRLVKGRSVDLETIGVAFFANFLGIPLPKKLAKIEIPFQQGLKTGHAILTRLRRKMC